MFIELRRRLYPDGSDVLVALNNLKANLAHTPYLAAS